MVVYQSLAVSGFRNTKTARLKVKRYPNGNGAVDSVWYYEVDGHGYSQRITVPRFDLTTKEVQTLMSEANDSWVNYWSVDPGELTEYAKQ